MFTDLRKNSEIYIRASVRRNSNTYISSLVRATDLRRDSFCFLGHVDHVKQLYNVFYHEKRDIGQYVFAIQIRCSGTVDFDTRN